MDEGGEDAITPATVNALTPADQLNRQVIEALQQDGRASASAIAAMCGASVPTISRRVQQLITAGVLKVTVAPAMGSTGPVETFVVSIGCQPGTQLDVAEALVARPEVRFAALITGSYDIMIELVVPAGLTGYPRTIVELRNIPGIVRWRSDLVLHVYKLSPDWSRQLVESDTDGRPAIQCATESEPCAPDHLDKVDWSILGILRDDGRASFKSVATALNLNESTVRRRFDRMLAGGCASVVTLVPAATLGQMAETLLTVTVEPGALNEVATALGRYRVVRYLGATLSGNSLLCEVIASSSGGLFEFITSCVSTLEGVRDWSASVELLTLKRAFVKTPWWRSQIANAQRRAGQYAR